MIELDIHVTYQPHSGHYLDAALAMRRISDRRKLGGYLLVGAVGIGCLVAPTISTLPADVAWLGVLLLTLLTVSSGVAAGSVLSRGRHYGQSGPISVQLHDEGVFAKAPAAEFSVAWATNAQLLDRVECWVAFDREHSIIIPKSALSADQREAFEDFIDMAVLGASQPRHYRYRDPWASIALSEAVRRLSINDRTGSDEMARTILKNLDGSGDPQLLSARAIQAGLLSFRAPLVAAREYRRVAAGAEVRGVAFAKVWALAADLEELAITQDVESARRCQSAMADLESVEGRPNPFDVFGGYAILPHLVLDDLDGGLAECRRGMASPTDSATFRFACWALHWIAMAHVLSGRIAVGSAVWEEAARADPGMTVRRPGTLRSLLGPLTVQQSDVEVSERDLMAAAGPLACGRLAFLSDADLRQEILEFAAQRLGEFHTAATRHPDPAFPAQISNASAYFSAASGDLSAALEHARRAAVVMNDTPRPAHASALHDVGVLASLSGELTEATRALQAAVDAAGGGSPNRRRAGYTHELARGLAVDGHMAEARSAYVSAQAQHQACLEMIAADDCEYNIGLIDSPPTDLPLDAFRSGTLLMYWPRHDHNNVR